MLRGNKCYRGKTNKQKQKRWLGNRRMNSGEARKVLTKKMACKQRFEGDEKANFVTICRKNGRMFWAAKQHAQSLGA